MRIRSDSLSAQIYIVLALAVLALNLISSFASFGLQILLVIYGLSKADVRFLPGLYLLLLDAAYFKFTGVEGVLKFVFMIPLSVLNIFCITAFFIVIVALLQRKFDAKSYWFLPLWMSMAIPAFVIGIQAKHDGVLSNWQTPFIYMMIPSFYYWGILVGRTWYAGRGFFLKWFLLIFCVQLALELSGQYSPGCQFQNHIIPIAFGSAMFIMRESIGWRIVGAAGVILGVGAMLFGNMEANVEMYGLDEGSAVVSTFTRFFVVCIGVFLVLTLGKTLKSVQLKAFPYLMLTLCTLVFVYAVARAGTTNQNEVVGNRVEDSKYSGLLARFEMKLVGDRGAVWWAAVRDELFHSPLIFKRYKDQEIYDPILGRMVSRMVPHNQFLTLVCRSGWWLGLGMMLFLWWMHTREFKMAARMPDDRATLVALVAPSAAIFIAVGLTGQHVFTQMWHASSMASLTFPGILYGAVLSRSVRQR